MKKLLLIYLFLYPSICDSQIVSWYVNNGKLYAIDPTTGINFAIIGSTPDTGVINTKYKSDTARNNVYTLLASKQAAGNYVTSINGGIGYPSGNGGTVTQLTSKSTGVTLNKLAGEITLSGAALAAATIVSFTLTDNQVSATDVMILNHVTTGTRGAYGLNAQCGAGSAVIYVRNNSAGSLSEAIVIRFVIIKSANN